MVNIQFLREADKARTSTGSSLTDCGHKGEHPWEVTVFPGVKKNLFLKNS